jgi:hypothetical protein
MEVVMEVVMAVDTMVVDITVAVIMEVTTVVIMVVIMADTINTIMDITIIMEAGGVVVTGADRPITTMEDTQVLPTTMAIPQVVTTTPIQTIIMSILTDISITTRTR